MFRWNELKTARKKGLPVSPSNAVEASLNPAEEKLIDNETFDPTAEEEKLFKKLFTGETKAPYHLYDRDPGTGPLRVGTHLDLGADMYSLLFVSFINWELVKKCTHENDETEHLKEKMLK